MCEELIRVFGRNLSSSLVLFWEDIYSSRVNTWPGPFLNELCVAAWSFFEGILYSSRVYTWPGPFLQE